MKCRWADAEEVIHEEEGVESLKALERMNEFYCVIRWRSPLHKAPTRSLYVAITEPHSEARVLAIKNAKTAGHMFHATAGQHLNSDEFFKARALAKREGRIKDLLAKKKLNNAAVVLEGMVTALLTVKGNPSEETGRNYTVPELKLLLKWKKVKPTSTKKDDLIHAFANHPPPPNAVPWSDDKEMHMLIFQGRTCTTNELILGKITLHMSQDRHIFICITGVFFQSFSTEVGLLCCKNGHIYQQIEYGITV
jgi:hypothetical protein